MSTYFIGDVHGCFDELQALLAEVRFDKSVDRLVFVGDLINRGPRSLDVLRFVRDLGDAAQVVLGNHDVSFIAYAAGVYNGKGTDFPEMLQAPDSEELVEWLRQQPLLIHYQEHDLYVVHAGIPPCWSLSDARRHAYKAEKRLRSDKFVKYLRHAYKNKLNHWDDELGKRDKFLFRLNGFTRMRYCDEVGGLNLKEKSPLGEQSDGLDSWFVRRDELQHDDNARIIFGHWAALGYYEHGNVVCLDSGCAWGKHLTAISFANGVLQKTKVSFINNAL